MAIKNNTVLHDRRVMNLSSLLGRIVRATNGTCGSIVDALLDVRAWEVRFFIVDRGLLRGRAAIPSPMIRFHARTISLRPAQEGVRLLSGCSLPGYTSGEFRAYVGWLGYLSAGGLSLTPMFPPLLADEELMERDCSHLCSAERMHGQRVRVGGAIGKVVDVILDVNHSKVISLVVSGGLAGALPTNRIRSLRWTEDNLLLSLGGSTKRSRQTYESRRMKKHGTHNR